MGKSQRYKRYCVEFNGHRTYLYCFRPIRKALSYYEKGLAINRELKFSMGIAVSLDKIGEIYRYLGLYEEALFIMRKR